MSNNVPVPEAQGANVPAATDLMKSRIKSWVKSGEEDAAIADKYLDKKKEKLHQRQTSKNGKGTV